MKGNHYYGWENSSKPRKLPWRLNITYWQKCFLCYKFAKQMFVYYTRYEKVCIYFCLYYHPANWELHSWFANWARGEVENGSPFTWLHSALNKKNKTYLPTFSARDNFSFYERKKISLKTTPQFNITDISKNLLQAFENQEEQESLYCFESSRGKLVYQEYTYILWCFFVIV